MMSTTASRRAPRGPNCTTDPARLGLRVCTDAGFVRDVVCDTGDVQAVVSLGWGVALIHGP